MLRGGIIVITCLFSYLFVGMPVYRHHILGVLLCVVGFVLVGVSSIFAASSGGDSDNSVGVVGNIIGMSMVSLSLVVQSTQFVYQEKVMHKIQVSPQRMVGLEGMFGIVFMFIWLMIFSFVQCPSSSMCDVKQFLIN